MGTITSNQWFALVNGSQGIAGGDLLAYDRINKGLKITTDGSGNTNREGWKNAIRTPTVNLLAGHAYQFVVRMKADIFPRGQNIMLTLRDSKDSTQYSEYAWNVSKIGAWEDVYLPIYPSKNGSWRLDVWVNTTLKYLSTSSTLYIDPDIDVYEIPSGTELLTTHSVSSSTDKDAFSSSTERIDGLGNIYLFQNGDWKHVFPRMIYKGDIKNNDRATLFQRYRNYGFTGIMDAWTETDAQVAISSGLEHIGINANSDGETFQTIKPYISRVYQWAETKNKHANILWYNFDNENRAVADYVYQQSLQEYIDSNHIDPQTGKRRHPIYYLNGNIGLPRTYHNGNRNVMDITGSYVGNLSSVSETSNVPPIPTLLSQFLTHNQRAPNPVIQLQAYLNEGFIPSLFYGIIQGGKALCVWRDGTTFGGAKTDFRENVWASAFKDDVSPKIDQMLPLIEQPHFTSWKAWTNQFPNVRIGTRELNGTGYLILTNFAAQDLTVVVSLNGKSVRKAVDMFTGAQIATVANGQFQFTLGHYNNGYRVIRLVP